MKKSHVTLVLGLVVGGIGGYYLGHNTGADDRPREDVPDTATEEIAEYINADLGLSFTYRQNPDGYVLIESDARSSDDSEKALTLFKRDDWEEFEASVEPREGPPGISLEVFRNDSANTETWLMFHPVSNYELRTGAVDEYVVDEQTGLMYEWDGLYRGKSFAVIVGENVYLFGVTYINSEDGMLADFNALLDSVRFSN